MSHLRIGVRLVIMVGFLLCFVMLTVGLGHRGMNLINASLKTVYEDRTVCLSQLSEIQSNISHARIRVLGFVATGGTGDRAALTRDVRADIAAIEKTWAEYKSTYLPPAEQKIAREFEAAWSLHAAFADQVLGRIGAGDVSGALEYTSTVGAPIYRTLDAAIDEDIALQRQIAKEEYAKGRQVFETTATLNWVVALIGGVVALFLAWVVVRSITVPVAGMVEAMIGLAGGDTTVEIPARERRDEVGDMAKAVEVFKRNAIERLRLEAHEKQEIEARQARHARIETLTDEFDKAVINLLKGVGDAASTMLDTAGTLTANAELTQSQSAAVSSATEQASTNVNVIAAASTELLASVQEIGSQVTRAATISSNAAAEAHDTNDKVSGLAAAANRVGEVVGLITSIANQTNLLALNATIEAARAGDAGKGFAVVASEVKNLASQTAKATEEIAGQIGAIQAQTEDTVAAIRRIISVIGEINEMSSAIAGAVEEQGAAMQEVVRNVEEAAKGTSEVARSIVQVAEAAEGTGRMAGSVQSAANSLTRQNDCLRVTVEGFLSSIKAT